VSRFLTAAEVLAIHDEVLAATGGAEGLRDLGLLESAVARPLAGFGETLLHPDRPSQAAALLQSLASNHPFVDGNKRTAFTAMDVFLRLNGARLEATEDDKYGFVIDVVTNRLEFEGMVAWLNAHIRESP
jgi:death-on-curing protein